MRFTFQFFSLLLALSCFAQPSPINRRAMVLSGLASSTPITPQTIGAGLRFWWVSTDITNNVTVSNQWIDRIQSKQLFQMDTTKSPTNSSLGVRFNGSPFYLTNVLFEFGTGNGESGRGNTGSVFVIMSVDTPAASIGGIICGASASGRGLYATSGNKLEVFGSLVNPVIGNFPVSTLMDYISSVTNNNGQNGGGPCVHYTNSVLAVSNADAGWFDTSFVGADNEASRVYMKGYIREIAYFSNYLSGIQISNLHYYRTNTYGGSP